MRRLRSLLALPRGDRFLLLKAATALVLVRASLTCVRFVSLQRRMARLPRGEGGGAPRDRRLPRRVAWAVALVSGHGIGTPTCLVQALTVQTLLARHGYPSRLWLGVARNPAGGLDAHAWVEADDELIIGGPASHVAAYTSLSVLDVT